MLIFTFPVGHTKGVRRTADQKEVCREAAADTLRYRKEIDSINLSGVLLLQDSGTAMRAVRPNYRPTDRPTHRPIYGRMDGRTNGRTVGKRRHCEMHPTAPPPVPPSNRRARAGTQANLKGPFQRTGCDFV